MDGWKTIISFWDSAYFQWLLLLVLGSVKQQTYEPALHPCIKENKIQCPCLDSFLLQKSWGFSMIQDGNAGQWGLWQQVRQIYSNKMQLITWWQTRLQPASLKMLTRKKILESYAITVHRWWYIVLVGILICFKIPLIVGGQNPWLKQRLVEL